MLKKIFDFFLKKMLLVLKIILSLQRTLSKIYYAYIILLFRIEILFSLK